MAADAMPGGAPIRERRAKKKKKGRARRAPKEELPPEPKKVKKKKAKKPCKYGPRGEDGYCPKKPKKAKKEGDNWILDQEVAVGVTRGGNVKKTTLRKEVGKGVNKLVSEISRKGVDQAMEALQDPNKRAAIQAAAVLKFDQAKAVLRKAGFPGAVVAFLLVASTMAGRALAYDDVSKRWAREQLAAAKRGPGGKGITKDMEKVLLKQYYDWFKPRIMKTNNVQEAVKL